MLLPTTIWVGLAMLFLSTWWVVEDFLLGLNANYFFYPLAVGGIGCNVDALEKSDKAEIKVSHFVSSMLTSCIMMLTMFDRLDVDRLWRDPLKEEALLWRSSKHLGSENFDQQCSVNLIMRRVKRLKSEFRTLSLHVNIMHGDVNDVRSARRRSTVTWSVEGRNSSWALFQTSWIWKLWSEV